MFHWQPEKGLSIFGLKMSPISIKREAVENRPKCSCCDEFAVKETLCNNVPRKAQIAAQFSIL